MLTLSIKVLTHSAVPLRLSEETRERMRFVKKKPFFYFLSHEWVEKRPWFLDEIRFWSNYTRFIYTWYFYQVDCIRSKKVRYQWRKHDWIVLFSQHLIKLDTLNASSASLITRLSNSKDYPIEKSKNEIPLLKPIDTLQI